MNSVKNDGYLLEILVSGEPVEKVIYRDSNYYSLPQGTGFSVRLTNDHRTRVDAHLWVDGKKAGIWRINPYSRVTASKFVPSGKPFTAWDQTKSGTFPMTMSLYHPWGELQGLVRVVFVPEKNSPIISTQGYTTPDWLLYRHECSQYTDGTTPNDKTNRKCNLRTPQYERRLNVGQYGNLPSEMDRGKYRMMLPLEEVDEQSKKQIIVRVVVDNDHARYRRGEAIWRETTRPDRVPPRLMLRNPSRPHTCSTDSPFLLSRKYWFGSNF